MRRLKREGEREARLDVLDGVADEIVPLLDEMEELKTLEARLVEAAEELQIIMAAMFYAKEGQGDITEYRRDAAQYDPLGIDPAKQVAQVVEQRLGEYLGDRPHWEIGYRRRSQEDQ